jgi:hypothetical protein
MTAVSVVTATPENATKSGSISIRPYFDPKMSNLGLEKYGASLFDGVFHEEQLALIERNGIKRYLTGLNEFAPEVKLIKDKDQRESKILDIRNTVAQLEKELAVNIVEPNDPEFWNKIKLLKPDNDEFWGKISLRTGNAVINLDPVKDPYDLIKIYAIEAGGFSGVARSYEEARSRAVSPKFYLDRYVETVSTKTEVTKLRNRSLAELQKLFDKNQNKLLYVAKVVDANSTQYKKSTPNDVVYENMDRYITGNGVEPNLKRAAESFLAATTLDMETLKIRAIVKDSSYYKFIHPKPDGFIYHTDTTTMMGRNASDCLDFLKNPLNESILVDLTKKVEEFWNK